ncbi:MAG: glycoside hydrolase/phage tail family protein [Hyphomicrobiales bacterium]|nr:glycoside hydrolase/phage tail family protein [Hyphomicrobiales bacterium]
MATVVLQYAGAAVGTFLGGPVGGIIGRAVGAVAGNIVDQNLFGSGTRRTQGPRLNDLRVMASEEGAPIPRLWGRMRISGQVIWATNFEEVSKTTTQKSSSKGGPKSKATEYSYFANFAVGLCEGVVDRLGRVWADGKEIDLSPFTTRFYRGVEDQDADSLIVAKEGVDNAPAYRGLAYIVFERLPLESFGNRLPQLSFEVISSSGGAASHISAVNIIPGSTEFGYDTTIITRKVGDGVTATENAHASSERSDWTVSIDDLTADCANLKAASLVVPWFGTDLRCGVCQIRPGVENTAKVTKPEAWEVAGIARAAAHVVSTYEGRPAYGGTPNDASVIRAIADLRERGLKTVFYPFILMDVAGYPWRGRITCDPPSVDKTAVAATQVQDFVGSATPGPAEWSYRRFILHYANLCASAGGVDAFVIGSELRGLTTLRSSATDYPFVAALIDLAADVKAILPSTKITYGADWSEWFGHHPPDGSGDVFFHLDPLWASPGIDMIGIDNYLPLTDWRDGRNHLDRIAGSTSIYDADYLKSGIAGGEGFDWYYADETARNYQLRTPISDGASAKPWVFRNKDLKSWWSNEHYDRPLGVEAAMPTSWVPQSKPIWFTEVGCPAIDKGANQPNTFFDAKSSESAVPYYSSGARDDLMQARFVSAISEYWSEPGAHNPVSAVYGEAMVDADRMFFWAWDARPFPAFPARGDIWSDAANYPIGHWLNGRITAVGLDRLIAEVCGLYGLTAVEVDGSAGLVDGFLIERPMSARDALENLLAAFALDAIESDGILKFRSRKRDSVLTLTSDDYVETDAEAPLFALNRAQESELPNSIRLLYAESSNDYRNAVVEARKSRGESAREVVLELPCATTQAIARSRAEVLLQENWSGRETISFSLAPHHLALEPGDVVTLGPRQLRIAGIHDGIARKLSVTGFDAATYEPPPAVERGGSFVTAAIFGEPDVLLMDLAMAATANPVSPWIAAQATPWPGRLAVLKRTGAASLEFNRFIEAQATMGNLLTPLAAGPLFVFDRATSFDVVLKYGALSSVSEAEVLNGANIAVVGDAASGFEIIQFASAELIGPNTYRVKTLLRGQAGSGPEMLASRAAPANFVLLNPAVVQAELSASEAALENTWRVGPAQLDSGHSAYLELTLQGQSKALRPLSPCQLRASRDGADVVFTWIRRSRVDGDGWEPVEIPLGEDSENYRLDILDGVTVKRSVDVSNPGYRYLAADIAADFGVAPANYDLRLAQISAGFGVGATLAGSVSL